ncbi:NUDIX domain-containing protein [Streptomyces ipomoeae]|uniref:NUDIX domain-containing protein n=1 Tax=Streptomyces ipomoeae TaxID=103232 RepID=A0AAE8VSV1_9ACTN|nr:NUDIX domain-containing protein [Streptomyces ipomoeae]TQE15802.1 NUDIX domain-containing protein [Streptomyces ipomoeae]
MEDLTPRKWNEYYDSGQTFRHLGDTERRLLAKYAPALEGAIALDVGCGLGELACHLSDSGYRVDAIDYAWSALHLADQPSRQNGHINYQCLDIEQDSLDRLPHPAYDLITFRLSWAFIRDRTRVMNRLRERLRPGGTLCVITPVVSEVPENRRHIALDEEEIGWLCGGWRVAERHDADGLAFIVLRDPVPASVRYTSKGRPSPHALTGAGVVVTDPVGRILLGWSARRSVWELPGGKDEAGEDFVDAAVRELQEETGLKVDRADARLLALLKDSTHGITRMTAAVRITAYTGEPTVTEPHLIRRWEWHEVTDLPALAQPLFTPSAHVINTVWPGLLPDLPPVHRYPLVPADMIDDPQTRAVP